MRRKNGNETPRGGLVVGMTRDGRHAYYTPSDTHSLVIGTTRSGKTRSLVLPSVGLTAMAGENMVLVDMKGELHAYTRPFLEALGYEVIAIDFASPRYSNRYNFLQPVIDALSLGDTSKAVSAMRDAATMLVPDGRTQESIWTDGERAVLTMAGLCCVFDNFEHPEYQNLSNVQQFITHMCRPVGRLGNLPLNLYLSVLPDGHPAKLSMGISQIAPEKMRGSFYTSALTTLDLFSDAPIHTMTSGTDFDPEKTATRRRAIFVILPDYKKTYHFLAALFIYQQYQCLADYADRHGGRLDRRVHFFCDEFGNFVKIPDFDTLMTVSGGRGIRWHLFIQNTEQLDEKYGDKVGRTIRANAETWIYLQSESGETRKEISERLGNYTVRAPSLSSSTSGQGSASCGLTGRALMTADEIHMHIKRPWQLVMSRAAPAVMYAPDLSETVWNAAFGMGDPAYDRALRMLRERERREVPAEQPHYWGIWNKCREELLAAEAAAEKGKGK